MTRLTIWLCPGNMRPTEEARVLSPRLLQMETERPWPSALGRTPRPSTLGAPADGKSEPRASNPSMHGPEGGTRKSLFIPAILA